MGRRKQGINEAIIGATYELIDSSYGVNLLFSLAGRCLMEPSGRLPLGTMV